MRLVQLVRDSDTSNRNEQPAAMRHEFALPLLTNALERWHLQNLYPAAIGIWRYVSLAEIGRVRGSEP